MKKFITLMMCLASISASAQYHYTDANNPEMLHHVASKAPCRKVFTLPVVNGYNIYLADLHTHSAYSDGSVLPKFRIAEAWQDGLDIIAITEHIEYRPAEKAFYEYLKKYTAVEYNKEKGINIPMVDLNTAVNVAATEGENYDILVIPGSEITRNGTTVGHFNALFTTDNNLIYDEDPVQAIRNAKAQGALVMHNHPGWRKTSLDFTDTEKIAYEEGLIDGVEVMNGSEFYPGIIDRVQERGLFIAANSDIHGATAVEYRLTGSDRPMTLILARDKSMESIREALESNRTIALGYGELCGEEGLLAELFKASITFDELNVTEKNKVLQLTNKTSIPYLIQLEGKNPIHIDPHSAVRMTIDKNTKMLKMSIINMWCSADSHPVVELGF
jgi:hypothetical protein